MWWRLVELAKGVGWCKHSLWFWTWLEFELAVKVTQWKSQKACSVSYAASPKCPENFALLISQIAPPISGLNMLTHIWHMDRRWGPKSTADLGYDHESTGHCTQWIGMCQLGIYLKGLQILKWIKKTFLINTFVETHVRLIAASMCKL